MLENQVVRLGKPFREKSNHCVASPVQDCSVLLFFIRFCKNSVDFAPRQRELNSLNFRVRLNPDSQELAPWSFPRRQDCFVMELKLHTQAHENH